MADLKGLNRDEQGRSTAVNMAADDVTRAPTPTDTDILGLKNPAFWYSGGFITVFVLMAIFAEEQLAKVVNIAFT